MVGAHQRVVVLGKETYKRGFNNAFAKNAFAKVGEIEARKMDMQQPRKMLAVINKKILGGPREVYQDQAKEHPEQWGGTTQLYRENRKNEVRSGGTHRFVRLSQNAQKALGSVDGVLRGQVGVGILHFQLDPLWQLAALVVPAIALEWALRFDE